MYIAFEAYSGREEVRSLGKREGEKSISLVISVLKNSSETSILEHEITESFEGD